MNLAYITGLSCSGSTGLNLGDRSDVWEAEFFFSPLMEQYGCNFKERENAAE
jgi:hypothetical protein